MYYHAMNTIINFLRDNCHINFLPLVRKLAKRNVQLIKIK